MPESGWQKIQENTFRRWCTRNLKVRGMKIDDLSQDFSDGLLLIALLEVLSGKKFGPHDHNPKNRLQKLANCGLCVDFIKSEGVRIEFIGGVDIVDGNLQRILGLVWTLILHYQINLGFQPRQALLSWIQVRLPDKGIKNFTTDWNSGINLAALVDSVVPGLCSEHATMDASMPLQNAKLAMDRAEQRLNIPQILTPEELVNPKIDELSVMTYMSFFPECKPNEHVDEPDVGPNPLTWTADGPGIGKCVQANDETHFTVYPGIGKLSELQVKLLNTSQGRIEFPVEFEAIEDGTILVTYNTAEPGHYQIFILVAGLDITGSPYEVAVIDVTKVRVVMPERNLKVGDIVTCNVDASLAGPGQITANAVIPGGDERHCQITALSEGRYKAEVALNVPGEYMITVSLEGILVLTNPLVIADFHEPNVSVIFSF